MAAVGEITLTATIIKEQSKLLSEALQKRGSYKYIANS